MLKVNPLILRQAQDERENDAEQTELALQANSFGRKIAFLVIVRVTNLQNFTPVSALLGGALIGFSTVLLLGISGRIAGISSIMSGLITTQGSNRHWRIVFLIGLMLGSGIWQLFTDTPFELRQGYPLWLIVPGGLLVGLGTRIGSGCTSGHGICGIALFSKRSIAATLMFMSCGLLTVFVLRHLFTIPA